jgi:signal transduction histidine kinase
MFDQFPVHLYAKDEDARHLMVSRHNKAPTDLVGITDLDYDELPKEHREAAFRDEMRVIENEEPQLDIEEFTDYIDSHTLTSKVPWYGPDGDVVGLVGHTQEITERKQREHAARRQHELLVKVALAAAYELRNELQVASGRLEFVEEDSEQYEVVDRSHRRLASIIDTVVELATEERAPNEPKKLWLSTLGREVWTTLDTDDATLQVEGDALLLADPEAVTLLVQILLSNAVEHTDPGVSVSIGGTPDGFFVADDGEGIAVHPPSRAFDAGVTTHENGTGFGLYVARSIAADNDWTLSLTETDSGARFDVSGVERIE